MKFKLIQISPFYLVEEAVYKWRLSALSAHFPISYAVLKEKSLFFYDKIKERNIEIREKFEASDGWICNFLSRFNLSSKNYHGESESVNVEVVKKAREELKNILLDYHPDDIYNADEKGEFDLSVEDYIDIDSEVNTFEIPDDNKIIENVLIEANLEALPIQDEELVDDEDEPKYISFEEGKELHNKYIQFL
ncbi:unnamed protein product [Brachionus calyciflorus]|uniref:HTH CENPB-type domain-containing protein n=1 Tax=Brachionus calyciflorus TaxID=104777 RepID=A0A813WXF7_9BILA|nr:unnamed protein product [Brachionus calyciflorus]